MITNITTGHCHYRQQRKQKPYFVCWQDRKQTHYAYFATPFLAECYKNNMVKQTQKPKVTQEQVNRVRELMLNLK
jgi:hypothetical protein